MNKRIPCRLCRIDKASFKVQVDKHRVRRPVRFVKQGTDIDVWISTGNNQLPLRDGLILEKRVFVRREKFILDAQRDILNDFIHRLATHLRPIPNLTDISGPLNNRRENDSIIRPGRSVTDAVLNDVFDRAGDIIQFHVPRLDSDVTRCRHLNRSDKRFFTEGIRCGERLNAINRAVIPDRVVYPRLWTGDCRLGTLCFKSEFKRLPGERLDRRVFISFKLDVVRKPFTHYAAAADTDFQVKLVANS
ncbi:hypothetical protein D3C85_317850 [compost metagenome]